LSEFHASKRIEVKLSKFDRRFEEYAHVTGSMISAIKDLTTTIIKEISTKLDAAQNVRYVLCV